VHSRSGVVRAADLLDQLVTARSALGILLHDLAEELSDVIQSCVLCIANVLAVVMPALSE
jgi:hypothetical protein